MGFSVSTDLRAHRRFYLQKNDVYYEISCFNQP